MPIVNDSNGTTTVYDVSLRLTLDGAGNVVFENFSQITSPSVNNVENFIAGTYEDSEGETYVLSGPAVLDNGRTGWALTLTDEGKIYNASWITGSPADHPSIGSRSITPELSTGFAYGVQGTNDRAGIRKSWNESELIGAQQVGDSLILSLFDGSTPSPTRSINLIRVVP